MGSQKPPYMRRIIDGYLATMKNVKKALLPIQNFLKFSLKKMALAALSKQPLLSSTPQNYQL